MKVTAIDPISAKEATVIGPRSGARKMLENMAIRKLKRILNKNKN